MYRRWLAHQDPTQLERCVEVPVGRRRIAVCTRCLALYPSMFLTLAVLLTWRVAPLGWVDYLWSVGASVPALLDWGASRLRAAGSNPGRLVTGALLGVGVARSFALYLAEPASEVFWIHGLVVVIVIISFEAVRALDFRDF